MKTKKQKNLAELEKENKNRAACRDNNLLSLCTFQCWRSSEAPQMWALTCRRWRKRAGRWWGRRRWPSRSFSARTSTASPSWLLSSCSSLSSCLASTLWVSRLTHYPPRSVWDSEEKTQKPKRNITFPWRAWYTYTFHFTPELHPK